MFGYKLIASDLDGTLFDNHSEISEENYNAIKEMTEKGILFVPSSGRSFIELPDSIRNNPYIRYIVHSNGSVIFDKQTGNRTLNCISGAFVLAVFDIINSYPTHITIRANGRCYADTKKQTDEAYKRYNVQLGHGQLLKDYAEYVDDFDTFCKEIDNVELLSVFFENDEDMLECEKRLIETGKLLVAQAIEHNLEICSISAGKGNAIKCLSRELGIDIKDIIAVGDSDNDITALSCAGLGLAVSNACYNLKSVADKIICTNEEHAIKYIWDNF